MPIEQITMPQNPTPTFEDVPSPEKVRVPEPIDELNQTTPVNIETSALIEDDFQDSFEGEESDRGFNITLQKCDTAKNSSDAATPKMHSPEKRQKRVMDTPEKLNYTSIGNESEQSFFMGEVDQLMLAREEIEKTDFSKTLGQAGPKRSDRFNDLETQSMLDTSLTIEQQERIEFLKAQRQCDVVEANTFSDAVEISPQCQNLQDRKKAIIDQLAGIQ